MIFQVLYTALTSFTFYLFLLFLSILYFYLRVFNYWKFRGVQGPTPVWFIGNLYSRLRSCVSLAEFDQNLYNNYGGKNYCGFYEFSRPVLMVGDPNLLKQIMIKDFDHFTDRSIVVFNEPIMDNMLLGLKSWKWKRVRSVMTPIFSSGKNEFIKAAGDFLKIPCVWKRPFLFLQVIWPHIARRMGFNVFDRTPIHFFSKVVSDTMKYRLEYNIRRNDFLQLMLDASKQELINNNKFNEHTDADVLTECTIAAQCVLFYIAGFETTATTLSFVSYCLALNPDIQQKVKQEIDEVLERHNWEVAYDAVQEMTYLDMDELTFFSQQMEEQKLDFCIHRDPEYYHEPLKFDPERFSNENKSYQSQMVYLPFGAGPRNCIGMRFGLMETKVAMIHLLQEFVILPCCNTKVPVNLEKNSGLLKSEDGIWLKLAKRV